MSDSNSLVGKLDSNTFPFEDGKLTANCSNKDSDECLTQLTTYKSVNKLHLEGFVFNEMNIKLFSNVICEMHIQELTLDQCNINDDLVNLLILPSGLKSIRLVDLNFSLVGIQSILDKLNHLLESFEVVDCLRMEVPQQKASTNSMVRKESLDLSRYSNLKTISIENSSKDFDSCNLLLSLTKLSLEKIKLSCIHLSIEEWTTLLNKWKEAGGIVFLNTLKVFDIEIQSIDESIFIQLIQFLFSIPSLEVLSLKGRFCLGIISLPPLPSTIKQFSLFPLKSIFMEDGKTLFCNSTNLSHLTHLTACNFFDEFPFDLFTLNQLEYLEIITMKTSRYSLKPIQPSGNLKYLSIQAKYLISLLFRFEIKFPVIETLVVRAAFSVNFDVHLKRIISSKTLKSLQIHYEYNDKFPLEIDAGTINSIEELKLDNVFWQFVCELIDPERFPCLTKIHLKTENCDLDLKVVLEKLSLFPKLNSLVLIGDFWLSNEELSFTFPNLTFFCLDCTKGRTIDLDYLLTCMPNLFALQLGGTGIEGGEATKSNWYSLFDIIDRFL